MKTAFFFIKKGVEMTLTAKAVTAVIKFLLRTTCRVNDAEMKKLPAEGPYIVIINHINFLEVPMIMTHLLPRPAHGLVKKENMAHPFFGYLGTQWGAIPVDRENPSTDTFKAIQQVLSEKKILIIAPEGTRTGDGRLIQAKAGVVTIALQNNVPIYPVAHYGGEKYWSNFKKFKRTGFVFKVGKPFIFRKPDAVTKTIRNKMADELMIELAKQLPIEYHGYYTGRLTEKPEWIELI
jgi:1-acyl-sn-glycerol-3-phosphate acyltransferase